MAGPAQYRRDPIPGQRIEPCACGGLIHGMDDVRPHNKAYPAHQAHRRRVTRSERQAQMRARRYILLGPLPCKACRAIVYYGEDADDTARLIRGTDGWSHRCSSTVQC
jgi:hypothetical protein